VRDGRFGVLLALAALNLVWGGSLPATKIALEGFGPLTLAALRLLIASACFAPFVLSARSTRPRGRELVAVAGLGVIGFTGTQVLQALGAGSTTAAAATVLASTGPLWMALLAPLLVGERLAPGVLAGIVLSSIGILLVVAPGASAASLGGLVVLLSSGAFALYSVLGKRVGARASPLVVAAVGCAGGALAALPLAGIEVALAPPEPTATAWAMAAYLSVVVTFAGFAVWLWGVRRVPVAQAGALLFLQPVSGLVLSALVLGESLPGSFLLGAGLVIAGVCVAARG
jgi:drug/metabolite transporter (DMT)-like permease